MARGARDKTPTIAVPRERRLATNTARDRLFELVNELAAVVEGSPELSEHAVEIGPRGRGGALLIPTADAEAALARMQALEDRVEELEQEIEDLALGQLIEERRGTPEGELLSVEELAESVGRGRLLPGS